MVRKGKVAQEVMFVEGEQVEGWDGGGALPMAEMMLSPSPALWAPMGRTPLFRHIRHQS